MGKSTAAKVGELMSHGFVKSWPQTEHIEHILTHMLQWPSFPLYVETFCKYFTLTYVVEEGTASNDIFRIAQKNFTGVGWYICCTYLLKCQPPTPMEY